MKNKTNKKMETTFNETFNAINLFLDNHHKEKIARAKLKFQQEKENEKGFNKKDKS